MPRSSHFPRSPLLALALLSGLRLGGVAQADYLGGITFSHTTTNDLPHGAEITISIDYKVDHPDGGRIFARPFTNGSQSPGSIASGGPLVPQGSGTVTQTFTIAHGGALVNEVQLAPDDTGTDHHAHRARGRELSDPDDHGRRVARRRHAARTGSTRRKAIPGGLHAACRTPPRQTPSGCTAMRPPASRQRAPPIEKRE